MRLTIGLRGGAAALAVILGLIGGSLAANSALAQSVTGTSAAAEVQTDIPVTAVTLYSSGVGYFQHDGNVTGNATAVLPFKVDQINDVLKSLLLQDTAGQVTDVTYASQDPLAKTLRSFQVDLTNNPSLGDLLNALRGAPVTVTLPAEQVTGTVVGVEGRWRPSGGNTNIEESYLNVFNGTTLRSVDLQDIRGLTLDDPTLQSELTKALAAVAAARDQDKRPVTVHFQGAGTREVRIGYVVETPIWKASYRLMLGPKDAAQLQGWAIVENQTDNDWNGVQLNLVSGRPISFVEDLYQPLYLQRPTLVPELYASLRPRIYQQGDLGQNQAAPGGGGFGGGGVNLGELQGGNPYGAASGAYQSKESYAQRMMATGSLSAGGIIAGSPYQPEPMNAFSSVISAASAVKLGELFQYTVGSVSLPRQSSAMIPIVSDPIQAERVSIYNVNVMPRNPLVGARLKNTTGKHLLGGPITVLDAGGYAGDAQIDNLPPGQDRLISYGIDLETTVDTSEPGDTDDTVTGKIVGGVLEVTHKYGRTTVYDIHNQADRDKLLVIEQNVRPGFDLVDSPAPKEKTDFLYRFELTVPAGKSDRLTVKEQQVADQGFAILDGDMDSLIAFSRTGTIPQAVKDALIKAAGLKRAAADAQRQLDQDAQREAAIAKDQRRIDENLRTIDKTSQLYARLVQKLDDQETELDKLRADEDTVTKQLNDLNQQLQNYLANLNVG